MRPLEAVVWWMGVAVGQTVPVPAIDAQRFRPTVDGRFTLWTDDAGRGESLRPTVRFLANYASEPLVYTFENGGDTALVQHLFQADLIAGISYQRFRIGAVVPVAMATSEVENFTAGLADVSLDAKAVVLDGEKAPLRIAFAGRIGFPTATLANALGARKLTWEATAIADRSFGDALFGVNVGIRGGPDQTLDNVRINDFAVLRASGGYQIIDRLGVGAELAADIPLQSDAAAALAAEWMVSARLGLSRGVQLRGGFGTGLTNGIATPDVRAVLGLVYQPEGPRDVDGDGIADRDDACKDAAEDMDGEEDEDGCPDDIGSIVVRVLGEEGEALMDAHIVAGFATGTAALQASLPAGTYTVHALAPGRVDGSAEITIVDTDVDKPLDLVLKHAPVPLSVTATPAGAKVTLDGQVPPASVAPGLITLEASADEHRTERRVIDVVGGVPAQVVFDLRPARVAFLVDEDGIEAAVQFAGDAELDSEAKALLKAVTQRMLEFPEARVKLLGGTIQGEEEALGLERATAVSSALQALGVERERLLVEGGGTEPQVELLFAE